MLYCPTFRRFYERLTREQALPVRQLDEAIQAGLFTEATTSPLTVPLDQDPFAGHALDEVDCRELSGYR